MTLFRALGLVSLGLTALAVQAQPGPCAPEFTPQSEVDLQGEAVLLVTHASSSWDNRAATKAGLDHLTATCKESQIPSVYLQAWDSADNYFSGDCQPSYFVRSDGGEFSFSLTARHVICAGGHLELCQQETVQDLAQAWGALPPGDLRLTQITDAVYLRGTFDMVRWWDPYYSRYKAYCSEHETKRLTLQEMRQVIADPAQERKFFRRYVGIIDLDLPQTHQIALEVDGQLVETLRERGPDAPLITIAFQTSQMFRASQTTAGLQGALPTSQ